MNAKVVITLAVVLLAAAGVALWRKRREKHRFIAIAVLTPSNTDLAFTPSTLTAAAERAWSYKFATGAGATDWVVGEAPILMVKAAGFHFIVNCQQRNYFTMSPPGQAPPVPPAWAPPHAGWFSVDLMATDSPRSDEEIYSRAGTLVSAIMADDAVALFLPDQGILVSLDTPSIQAQTRDALKVPPLSQVLPGLVVFPPNNAAADSLRSPLTLISLDSGSATLEGFSQHRRSECEESQASAASS